MGYGRHARRTATIPIAGCAKAPVSSGLRHPGSSRPDPSWRAPAVMHHLLPYIDPAAGSLIFQAVIATLLAVPFFLRTQIARVVRGIRRGPRLGDDSAS